MTDLPQRLRAQADDCLLVVFGRLDPDPEKISEDCEKAALICVADLQSAADLIEAQAKEIALLHAKSEARFVVVNKLEARLAAMRNSRPDPSRRAER